MNIEYKEQELLEQIRQGDKAAAETWLSLLTFQTYRLEQVPDVLCAAATGLKEVQGKDEKAEMVFGDLARLAAYKMYELVPVFKNRLVAHFSNPDAVSEKELSESIAAGEVLLEHRLIKNGGVFDLADAIADGLNATHDRMKLDLLEKAGECVITALPGSVEGDVAKVYLSIFGLAKRPSIDLESERVGALGRKLIKLESGEPNLTRMVGREKDRVSLRMQWAINLSPKALPPLAPLSDGDANLRNPMSIKRKAGRSVMDVVRDVGSKLAKKETGPQKQG